MAVNLFTDLAPRTFRNRQGSPQIECPYRGPDGLSLALEITRHGDFYWAGGALGFPLPASETKLKLPGALISRLVLPAIQAKAVAPNAGEQESGWRKGKQALQIYW